MNKFSLFTLIVCIIIASSFVLNAYATAATNVKSIEPKEEKDSSKTKEGDDGESSEADTFLADMVKKVNCDAKEIPYIFHRARSLSLKIGMSEIQNEFKGCQKSKALDNDKPSDEASKDQEGMEPIPPKSLDPEVIFVDRFKNPEKYEQNWLEPFGRMSTIILKNNSNQPI